MANLPACRALSFDSFVKTDWCIHLVIQDYAESIAEEFVVCVCDINAESDMFVLDVVMLFS